MTRRNVEILRRLVMIGAGLVFEGDAVETSMMTARIVIDALDQLGIPARPVAANVTIYNPAAVQMSEKMGGGPKSDEDFMNNWSPKGAHIFQFGGAENPSDAHVVVLVGEKDEGVVDLALERYSDPEANIYLAPLGMPTPEGFAEGKAQLILTWNGCGIAYMAFPESKAYERHPDWNASHHRRKQIVRQLVALCEPGEFEGADDELTPHVPAPAPAPEEKKILVRSDRAIVDQFGRPLTSGTR